MSKKSSLRPRGIWLFSIVLLITIVMAINYWMLVNNTHRGTFGDMFGVANTLFSGLAFLGVIYAILLQREELRLQRKELKSTRKELRGQKEEQIAQNKMIRIQTFENTFFKLLEQQNNITSSLIVTHPSEKQGRGCFEIFHGALLTVFNTLNHEQPELSAHDKIRQAFSTFYIPREPLLGHYYRSLFYLIRFIHESDVEDKRLYTNLVRAQLSAYELALLFYDCLSDSGENHFKHLVEEYSLLKGVTDRFLFDAGAHKALYEDSAFT